MVSDPQHYLREVQYRHPDRLAARALLHTRYGRRDWFDWLAGHVPLPPGGVVADVGCGAGAFWSNAPRSVPDDLRLRLFDLSSGMVDGAAAAVRATRRWAKVEARVADAAALPLMNGEVDTLLAIHMLYHLPTPERGAAEFARVVREGGTIAVVLNPPGTMAQLSALVDAALDREPAAHHEPLTSDQALPMLRDVFGLVERVRYEDELTVTDPVDLLAYVLSLPVADADGASDALAAAVERAFARDGTFRISKAADLLLCRR